MSFVGSIEVSGPPTFSIVPDAFSVEGARVEISKRFKAAFSNKKVALAPNKTVRTWQLVEDEVSVLDIFNLLEKYAKAVIEPGHLREVLLANTQSRLYAMLADTTAGNLCFMTDSDGKPRAVYLSRMKPGAWSLALPVPVGGPMAGTYRKGAKVLSY